MLWRADEANLDYWLKRELTVFFQRSFYYACLSIIDLWELHDEFFLSTETSIDIFRA